MRLKNKVALITGSGSGIGRASAELFAKEGAKVIVADINAKAGQEVVAAIKKAGGEATFVQVDVSLAADNKKMVDTAVSTYGQLDILFSNAGVAGEMHAEDEKEWRKVMDINLTGPYLACLYAIPQMKKQGGGKILFTSSGAGIKAPPPRSIAYPTSKAGVIMLGKSLSRMLAKDHIRVNVLCPGVVDTGLSDAFSGFPKTEKEKEAKRAAKIARIPLGRTGSPLEQAYAALFLASDESSFVHGITLSVDGGSTA